MRPLSPLLLSLACLAAPLPGGQAPPPAGLAAKGSDPAPERLERDLVARYGEGQRARVRRGLRQARAFWRKEDGEDQAFEAFARAQFAGDPKSLDALFARLEFVLESYFGHALEVGRDFRWHTELALGPLLPVDEILSGYDPGAHFVDDAFANKLAFVVLLNFPMSDLEERLGAGGNWTRRQWAEARLVDLFAKRVPAEANEAYAEASGQAERYIASYNIWMYHLLDARGERLFEPGKRLLSHWNLRDELKSRYAEGRAGLEKQRMIQKVMERIVTQTIPASVVDNPLLDWNPDTNEVRVATASDSDRPLPADLRPSSAPEPDTRYKVLLDCFLAAKKADPYSPTAPTHIARSFDEGRQLPEARVRRMLEEVCASPLVGQVAAVIGRRLGRGLEPFDIWYNGFRPGAGLDEAKLDALTRARYPTAAAYKADMPNLLRGLGFSAQRADWLAGRIEVDPARGSGHALGAQRRADNAHLRTRVGEGGMDYKGFNIAVHEMGHNVEQTFSLVNMDHWLLNGVPNTAFTEALAFVFQAQDLRLLGQPQPDARALAEKTLNDFWGAYEIAGVGLVDMAVWHWMYDHPGATPGQLKAAVLDLSREVWNRYYAPLLGQRDCVLLGVYSHMIDSFLYLPDYPIGHMIAFQIEQEIQRTGKPGETFERLATQGRLTPDLWMERATGHPVGPEALLEATRKALEALR
jgi:hypothetical protein